MKIYFDKPDIKVFFTSVDGDNFTATSADFAGDILSVQTNKDIDTPAGTFVITMIGRNNFLDFMSVKNDFLKTTAYDLYRPAGLVDIYINDQEIMMGMIDTITKSVSLGDDGKPKRIFVIAGRDLGSVLIQHKVWYDTALNNNREYNRGLLAGFNAFGVIKELKANELIEKIVNTWLVGVINQTMSINGQNISPFKFSDNMQIQDKLVCMSENKIDYPIYLGPEGNQFIGTAKGPGLLSTKSYADNYPISFSLTSIQSDLITFSKNFISTPLNEIYVDTGGTSFVLNNSTGTKKRTKGKCYLIMRPTPFNDKNFSNESNLENILSMQDLIYHKIDDSLIQEKSLSISSSGIPTSYIVFPNSGAISASMSKYFSVPEYDEIALRKYGYTPFQFSLGSYQFGTDKKSEPVDILCGKFQKLFKNWYKNTDKYLNGTFSLRGNEKLRIGRALIYSRNEYNEIEDETEEGYYYIKGVSQMWNYGSKFISMVKVERGVSKRIFNIQDFGFDKNLNGDLL